jgi:GTP cyclohydrolase I
MPDSKLSDLYKQILVELGENIDRDGLQKTPERAARSMEFLTRGYTQSVEEIINGAIFESDMDEMVIVKNIEFYSLCEHHLLPFFGKAHIAYIPNGKVIGLSKVARIVDVFARRLQIQENMTVQIADTILTHTEARGAAIVIEAQHLCMMMRGVERQTSIMTTSCMKGIFRDDPSTRNEFLKLIRTR